MNFLKDDIKELIMYDQKFQEDFEQKLIKFKYESKLVGKRQVEHVF